MSIQPLMSGRRRFAGHNRCSSLNRHVHPSNLVRHCVGFSVFACQVTVGLLVRDELLFVRIEHEFSAGPIGYVGQVTKSRRHMTFENVAVQILNPAGPDTGNEVLEMAGGFFARGIDGRSWQISSPWSTGHGGVLAGRRFRASWLEDALKGFPF